ncbi:hypothetical protein [Bacillus sp. 123MFChir2]|uniref:hypothetical protein n=1 Tax=Bacillus sp. 123MFChir2 TaxID=1169144 RepID=UPI0003644B10|nr:hypothetical protein [Bacillus sp. 123MFChir2]
MAASKGNPYISKLKNRHKNLVLFRGGREHLAVHRSGQGLFLLHAMFENKERKRVQLVLQSA